MRKSSRVLAAAIVLTACASLSRAQSAPLNRAMQQETAGQLRESIVSYREALKGGDIVAALLGLERVYTQLGWNDSLLAVAEGVVKTNPAEPMARTVQLRVLHTLKRDAGERTAFSEWVKAAPGSIEPYRAWSQLLLADGRTATVDSVLKEAERTFGNLRGLTLEIAQLRAALGQWDQATIAWREAVAKQDYLETAAAFSLKAAPPDSRRIVRAVLASPPVEKSARRLLANLELGWENGRDGWRALSELPLDDSTVVIWQSFVEEAERRGQYLAARDALVALERWRPDVQRTLRAAMNAVNGGEAQNALILAEQASQALGPRDGPKATLQVRLEAYKELARGADAQKALGELERLLSPSERTSMRRLVAWAWVRGGGVAEAKAMLADGQPNPDDELTGWLALYAGDLVGARRGLRRANPRDAEAVFAVAFVSRTRVDTSVLSGEAFLTVARRDSAKAAATFVKAAAQVEDAASVLLLAAARIHQQQKREDDALALWTQIVEKQSKSPEAAEAELEWARLLRRRGDTKGAITHLEHMILTWPDSALLPQARHELDLARAAERGGE
jgi:tetratricopeptide (TPR) repeat protein